MMGHFFKSHRIHRGISQTEMARKLNIKPQQLSNWERGACDPPLKYYRKIRLILSLGTMEIEKAYLDVYSAKVRKAMK